MCSGKLWSPNRFTLTKVAPYHAKIYFRLAKVVQPDHRFFCWSSLIGFTALELGKKIEIICLKESAKYGIFIQLNSQGNQTIFAKQILFSFGKGIDGEPHQQNTLFFILQAHNGHFNVNVWRQRDFMSILNDCNFRNQNWNWHHNTALGEWNLNKVRIHSARKHIREGNNSKIMKEKHSSNGI